MIKRYVKGWLVAAGAVLITVTAVAQYQPWQSARGRFRTEFLRQINQVRAQGCNCGTTYMPPAPPLTWNMYLERSAAGHATDMARQRYFSHTSKDGRSMEDRISLAGYVFNGYKSFTIGENIAWGQESIDEVMNGWINSPGHCKNLMNPEFKEVGVAENNEYWVQDFGGRASWNEHEQQMLRSGRMTVVQQQRSGH
jgi:uncharacterized protein YkwD